ARRPGVRPGGRSRPAAAPAARDKHRIDLHTDGVVAREQYERLARYLEQDGHERIEMTFAQVARTIGEELPASAYKHPAWWGSDPSTRKPYGSTSATWRGPSSQQDG
ncbi:hypothetical protein, partial [Microbispora triticiradicis]|uniref:DUF7662 domain-containing protein n=1 Tax=Microbispora triticiradicis TaxID=2200763 RepID=UPI001AD8296C